MDVVTRPEVDPSVEDVNNRDGRDDSMDQALLGKTLAMSTGVPPCHYIINTIGSFFYFFGIPLPLPMRTSGVHAP